MSKKKRQGCTCRAVCYEVGGCVGCGCVTCASSAPVSAPVARQTDVSATLDRAYARNWEEVLELANRRDGWLRMIPADDALHLKWKFTSGKWSGFYAYVRVHPGAVSSGVSALLKKLSLIDVGVLKPARDKLHSSYE